MDKWLGSRLLPHLMMVCSHATKARGMNHAGTQEHKFSPARRTDTDRVRLEQGLNAASGTGRTSAAFNNKNNLDLGVQVEGVPIRWNHLSLTGEWEYPFLCLIHQQDPRFRDFAPDYNTYLRENLFPFPLLRSPKLLNSLETHSWTLKRSCLKTLKHRTSWRQLTCHHFIATFLLLLPIAICLD